MKSKLLIISVMFALAISAVSPALAQTSTTTPTSSVSQIADLLAKVKELQAQLAALQQQQKDVSTELRETVQLTRSLYRGLSGDDVKELQEILATDPDIYPEGIVSGFFGQLTEQAVRRFQAKFGIAALGIVGPQTIAKIHALLEGDTIRPGLLKKAQNLTDKTNPAGACRAELASGPAAFVAKYGSNANRANAFGMCVRTMAQQMGDDDDEEEDEDEDEDDEDELEIADVDAEDITDTSATITWMTNASSTSKVYYSTEEGFDIDDDGVESEEDSDEVMEHSIDLSGLDPDTTYYFIVVSETDDDDEESDEMSFTTEEEDEE